MYKVKVEVRHSDIDGRGVFAVEDISKGTIVWQFTDGHDVKMTTNDFENLELKEKQSLKKVAYLSEQTNMWVIPPQNDPACFTNHNNNANTKSVFDPKISEEIVFVASRDIKASEEITDNYLEFDPQANPNAHGWLR